MEKILWLIAFGAVVIALIRFFIDGLKYIKTDCERQRKRIQVKYDNQRKLIDEKYNRRIKFFNDLIEKTGELYASINRKH